MTRYNAKIIIVGLIIAIKKITKSVWLLNTDFARSASGRFVAIVTKFLQYVIYLHNKRLIRDVEGLIIKKGLPIENR